MPPGDHTFHTPTSQDVRHRDGKGFWNSAGMTGVSGTWSSQGSWWSSSPSQENCMTPPADAMMVWFMLVSRAVSLPLVMVALSTRYSGSLSLLPEMDFEATNLSNDDDRMRNTLRLWKIYILIKWMGLTLPKVTSQGSYDSSDVESVAVKE